MTTETKPYRIATDYATPARIKPELLAIWEARKATREAQR